MPHWQEIKQHLCLGLPIGFAMSIEIGMCAFIALFLAPLGAQVVAGRQIVLNVISLLFMLPLSLGVGVALT